MDSRASNSCRRNSRRRSTWTKRMPASHNSKKRSSGCRASKKRMIGRLGPPDHPPSPRGATRTSRAQSAPHQDGGGHGHLPNRLFTSFIESGSLAQASLRPPTNSIKIFFSLSGIWDMWGNGGTISEYHVVGNEGTEFIFFRVLESHFEKHISDVSSTREHARTLTLLCPRMRSELKSVADLRDQTGSQIAVQRWGSLGWARKGINR